MTRALDQRMKLTVAERALLAKVRRLRFTVADLEWLARQLPDDTPVVLVAEIRFRWRLLMEPMQPDDVGGC